MAEKEPKACPSVSVTLTRTVAAWAPPGSSAHARAAPHASLVSRDGRVGGGVGPLARGAGRRQGREGHISGRGSCTAPASKVSTKKRYPKVPAGAFPVWYGGFSRPSLRCRRSWRAPSPFRLVPLTASHERGFAWWLTR